MPDITGIGNFFGSNTPDVKEPNSNLGLNDDDDNTDKSNPFLYGFWDMDNLEVELTLLCDENFKKINDNTNLARDTQDMSNRMDEDIAEAAKGDDTTREPVPDEVIKFMRDHNIKVDGESIDDYIKDHGGSGGLDKGSLQAVKAALDNAVNRDTDLSTQGQMTIQKLTQEIGAVITQMTGVLSKWGDIQSMLAQKISG